MEHPTGGNWWGSPKRMTLTMENNCELLSSTDFPIAMLTDMQAKKVFPSMENSSVMSYRASHHACSSFVFVEELNGRSLRGIMVAV